MEMSTDYSNIKLDLDLDFNMKIFEDIFKKDAAFRMRKIKAENGMTFGLIYFDGMVNNSVINESIVRPLVLAQQLPSGDKAVFVSQRVVYTGEVKELYIVSDIIRSILYGDALILIEDCDKALVVNAKGWRSRGISEPENERILQGPREGFDEAGMFNLAMIRRKLQTPDFCVESMRIGSRTDTIVFVCYLGSLVDKGILAELKRRLQKISIDGVLDTNYINEHIRDNKGSLFKTTGMTERPDIVAADLLEGRIAILVDGTPVVLTLPYLFSQNFQSDEDYYINYKMASVGRILRIICFLLSIVVPSLYLSLTTFHINLLPTSFALFLAEARMGVPFSPAVECVILIIIFEILKEAGLRMPQSVGHALSIVGGLVVGQAAVEARIISAPMLIAVALGGIAGLMLPRLKTAIFYCRISLSLLGAFLGIYGCVFGLVLILIHIFSISSFGVDYTQSIEKISFQSFKDTVFRAPWTKMINRPKIQNNNIKRQIDNEDI